MCAAISSMEWYKRYHRNTRHVYVTCNIEISMNWIDLYIIFLGWMDINLVCDISNYLPNNDQWLFFLYFIYPSVLIKTLLFWYLFSLFFFPSFFLLLQAVLFSLYLIKFQTPLHCLHSIFPLVDKCTCFTQFLYESTLIVKVLK